MMIHLLKAPTKPTLVMHVLNAPTKPTMIIHLPNAPAKHMWNFIFWNNMNEIDQNFLDLGEAFYFGLPVLKDNSLVSQELHIQTLLYCVITYEIDAVKCAAENIISNCKSLLCLKWSKHASLMATKVCFKVLYYWNQFQQCTTMLLLVYKSQIFFWLLEKP